MHIRGFPSMSDERPKQNNGLSPTEANNKAAQVPAIPQAEKHETARTRTRKRILGGCAVVIGTFSVLGCWIAYLFDSPEERANMWVPGLILGSIITIGFIRVGVQLWQGKL